MTNDLKEFWEIAQNTTPGPWWAIDIPERMSGEPAKTVIDSGPSLICYEVVHDFDAEHIATFDPPTVLELLARLEAAEAKIAAIEAAAEREHAGGCYYRHQQGEIDECNSCAAARTTAAIWEGR